MPKTRFVLAAILVQIGAGSAVAEEALPPSTRHRFGIDLGVASAVGLAGVGYQFAPLPWVRLEGAAGWGPTGTQLSIMPKIALGGGTCSFMAGFGASLAFGGQQAAEGHTPNSGTIPWLNLDVPGIECRSRSGF